MMSGSVPSSPETGQMVYVRQRPALVKNVLEKSDPETAQVQHLVEVEYVDGWTFPRDDTLIWEREINSKIYSQADLPDIQPVSQPDDPAYFNAFLNAIKWSTLNRIYLAPDEQDTNLNYRLTSPWYT